MNCFDSVLEMAGIEEGFFSFGKKPSKKTNKPEFTPVIIDSSIGKLTTVEEMSGDNRILKTVDPVEFMVFGNKYSNVMSFRNIGTNASPKYDPKEIATMQKVIRTLPSSSKKICKAIYEYCLDLEKEYFEDIDYNPNTGKSPTCRSLITESGCRNVFTMVNLDLYDDYSKRPVIYLNLQNDESFEEGLVCTVSPSIEVGSWESYVFDDAEE